MKCENCNDSGLFEEKGLIITCRECRQGWNRRESTLQEQVRHHGERLRVARSELQQMRDKGPSPYIIPN